MSIIDELKKWTHPYEDEDEEFDDFDDAPRREPAFEDRKAKAEERRNKVVNIHATTQLKVVLVKPERFENALRDCRPSQGQAYGGAEPGVHQQGHCPPSHRLLGPAWPMPERARSRRSLPTPTSSRPTMWILRAT